jgi:hypothetical protein
LPRWSPDGRELFFVENGTLVAVPIVGNNGGALRIGEPKRLFSVEPFIQGAIAPAFDVAPDGRRFLMTRAVGNPASTREELIVVQGFLEELRAKARGRP